MTINHIIADNVSHNQLKQIHKDSIEFNKHNFTASDYDFNVFACIVEVKLLKKI